MALEDATNPMQGVSGPSTFSKRTDLPYESQSYGDGVKYEAEKAGVKSVPALVTPNGNVLHINFGASMADVKG